MRTLIIQEWYDEIWIPAASIRCLEKTTDPYSKKKTKKEEAVAKTTETSGYLSLLAER